MPFKSMFKESFFRYLFTYIVYLLILLGAMAGYYWRNMYFFQKNELDSYSEALQNKLVQFQEQLSSIEFLGERLESDTRYRALFVDNFRTSDYVNISSVQKDFFYTMFPYLLVSDCGIYYENDLIITRYRSFIGKEAMSDYYENYFQVKDHTMDDWTRDLTALEKQILYTDIKVVSYDYGENECIILILPLRYCTLYAVMSVQDLARFFMPEDIAEEGYFYISDAQGKNILAYQFDPDDSSREFYEVREYDDISQLYFTLGFPKSQLNAATDSLINTLIIYIVFLLLGGIMLGVIFAWRNNGPLRTLVLSASSYAQPSAGSYKNEQEFVSNILKQLHTSVRATNEQLEQQKAEKRRHYLDKAIQGGINTKESLIQFQKLFPDMGEGYRIVILISMSDNAFSENMQLSKEVLMQQVLNTFYGCDMTITSFYTDTLLFLLPNCVERMLQEHGKATVPYLPQILKGVFREEIRIAVSDSFEDVLEMPSIYTATLYGSRSEWETRPQELEMEIGKTSFISLNFMYHQQFFEALSNGEETLSIALLRKIKAGIISTMETFGDRHIGEVVYRTIYMGILSSLCNIILQVKLNYFIFLNGVSIPTVQRFHDIDSFFEELQTCCHKICSNLKSSQVKKVQLSQQVILFLQEHLSDPDLSTQMTAEHFHISDNTLQKIIKSQTGRTFAEYVEEGRIRKAIQLLKTTNLSVESIALECGFSSYNSMYKVFKRRYNLSPKAVAETME